jgi:hypothetical protein
MIGQAEFEDDLHNPDKYFDGADNAHPDEEAEGAALKKYEEIDLISKDFLMQKYIKFLNSSF